MKKLLLFGALAFSLNVFGQVPSYVPINGLVAWYNFNGNSNDESGNGNNGSINGANLTNDRFNNPASAYNFDGINDYISINNTFDFVDRTFNFWYKADNIDASSDIILVSDNPNLSNGVSQVRVTNSNGTDSVHVATGVFAGFFIGSGAQTNTWQMITYTRSSNNILLYVNGLFISSTASGSYTSNDGNLETILGCGRNYDDNFFDGQIDDIGVWNRALSECEIQDLYNAQLNSTSFSVTQNGAQLMADQTGATYQWLDCDNNYAVINGETNQSYTPAVTGNYAVEVNMNGCVDTSACFLVDYTGIEELLQSEKELVKIVDFMGRETEFKPNTPLIFIYSDGTRERVMKLEE